MNMEPRAPAIAWESEAVLALRAVSTASDLALDRPERVRAAVKESRRDVITAVDLHVQQHILGLLAESGHAVIAEEGEQDLSALESQAPLWLVDPIDGTANYAAGMPFWAISVGLQADGDYVTGAVAIPPSKELYFTHGNRGAYLNGKALRVADRGELDTALVVAGFSGAVLDADARAREYALFGAINDQSRGCLRLGSAAAGICYVAAGRLQAAYGFNVQAWDVAGALAVAAQAGCKHAVRRKAGSTRVDFVVGVAGVVDQLLALASASGLWEGLK
jgi:myo-inositol-1(or 4)-monophosphatase